MTSRRSSRAKWPESRICIDRILEGRLQTLVIGIAILDDQPADAVGLLQRQAITDRLAVIHDIHRVAVGALSGHQFIDDIGLVGEGVGELAVVRRVALSIAWTIRRGDAVSTGEQLNDIADHVRRGRKSVQKKDHRAVGRTGLAVEHVEPVDRH